MVQGVRMERKAEPITDSRDAQAFIHGFPPIAAADARVLILGSMPGKTSLRMNRYYAHPDNVFWRVLGQIVGFEMNCTYDERARILRENGIAVWDVLRLCTRESSLDSDIDDSTVVPNDFAPFFVAHPLIRRVFFNGTKAESLFRKHVAPNVRRYVTSGECIRLPSTSPANAGTPFAGKLEIWRGAFEVQSVRSAN